MSTWEKLPAVEGSVACLVIGPGGAHASGALSDLQMHRVIAVGFGSAGASRDGESIYSETQDVDSEEGFWDVAKVEAMALADPDHDWRIHFHAPLYDAEYQRQGEGAWVLVRKGEGFA